MARRDAPDQMDVALGAAIRLRRQSIGVSQAQLAAACGTSFQQVQKYETGGNRVSFSRLVRIAAALKCRVIDLVDLLEGEATSIDAGEFYKHLAIPGAAELLAGYVGLSSNSQRDLLRFLTGLGGASS